MLRLSQKPNVISTKENFKTIGLCILLGLFGFWFSNDWFLFWDTVQFGSKHSLFFYEEGFSTILLPDDIDSGHPTFFGMYMALWLLVLGKHLWVLHLAMVPFTVLFCYFSYRLSQLLFYKESYYLLIVLAVCPLIIGHILLVSPDVVLCTGLVILLYGLLSQSNLYKCIGALLLCMISLRGGAIVFCSFVVDLYLVAIWQHSLKDAVKTFVKLLTPYLLGVSFLVGFLMVHYYAKAWIGYHEASPWAPSFDTVDLQGFVKNAIVFCWRILDLGMIFIYAVIVYLLIKKSWTRNTKVLVSLWISIVIILAILTLPYVGLLNHRYFIPLHIIGLIVFVDMLLYRVSLRYRRIIFIPVAILLLMGSYWQYPSHVARAWDVTPAHWSVYDAEGEMQEYLTKKKISTADVATVFPLLNIQDHLKLNNDMSSYQKVDLDKNQYILYSNTMNDFTDDQLVSLKQDWTPIHRIDNGQVSLILYQSPNQ